MPKHPQLFISKNEKHLPIKWHSTTGYCTTNFVTNERFLVEVLELIKRCSWDSLRINWGNVILTNGLTNVSLPYNVQVPLKEKARLGNLMKGSNYTAHLNSPSRTHMVYSKHNTPPLLSNAEALFPGSMSLCPQLMRKKQHKNPNRFLAIYRSKLSHHICILFSQMSDILLPAPASISSQEVDCKWVRRPFGGSVIRLDIARDTVSIDINVKSTRGHTSIHLTPWDSTSQHKKWNDTYRPREKISQQIGAFRAAERKARSSIHSRRISLNWTTRRGITHPFHHHLDYGYPAGPLDLYHHEENSMVPQGLEGYERPEVT